MKAFLILVILAASSLTARADGLVLTLTSPNGAVTAANPSVTFFGSVSNNSTNLLNIGTPGLPRGDPFSYLVQIQFQLSSVGLSYGPFSTFNELLPLVLDPGASTGDIRLFTLNIPILDQTNPAYTLLGTFTVFSYVDGGQVTGTTAPFTVQVPPGVPSPEPAPLLLLGTGLSTLVVLLRRRLPSSLRIDRCRSGDES